MNRYSIINLSNQGGEHVDVEKIIATFALLAGAFKAIASGMKDLHDISTERKKQKRRPPTKKKRRK